MKKSEFRKLIQEEIKNVLSETILDPNWEQLINKVVTVTGDFQITPKDGMGNITVKSGDLLQILGRPLDGNMVPVNFKGKEYTADRPVLLSRAELKPIKPLSGVNLGASFDKFKKGL